MKMTRNCGNAPNENHPRANCASSDYLPSRKKTYTKGLCRVCYDRSRWQKRPELYERHREYMRIYGKRWYAKYCEAIRERNRKQYAGREIAVKREASLKSRYGMSLEDYDVMVTRQKGLCAICHRPPRGKTNGNKLYVDHCHKSGQVRGLLCPGCNTALGQFYHDIDVLRQAIAYLTKGTSEQ